MFVITESIMKRPVGMGS